jgi:hypothetical protein
MATAAEMITAIDEAIESGISGPGEITSPDGRVTKFRSLDELMRLRSYYAKIYRSGNSTVRLGDFNV